MVANSEPLYALDIDADLLDEVIAFKSRARIADLAASFDFDQAGPN